MKCPVCEREGKRSLVYAGSMTSTAMAGDSYYDEDGKFHRHDPNIFFESFQCSEGHGFWRELVPRCPSCDYGGEEKLFEAKT